MRVSKAGGRPSGRRTRASNACCAARSASQCACAAATPASARRAPAARTWLWKPRVGRERGPGSGGTRAPSRHADAAPWPRRRYSGSSPRRAPCRGVLQRGGPRRRGAIRGVLLQHNEVRHRLDGHQTDPRMKGFVLAHRHRTRRHALGECRALLRDHGRFQVDIERVLRAVADPDEGRQPAQLQEFTHQAGAARRPQGDAEMRRQNTIQCSQAIPSGVRTKTVKPAGGSPPVTSRHHPCKVLRATPISVATARCVSPAASRVSAAAMCSACSKRERRVMRRCSGRVSNVRAASRSRLVLSEFRQDLRTSFRTLGEFALPREGNFEGPAKSPHVNHQALDSDLAGLMSEARYFFVIMKET